MFLDHLGAFLFPQFIIFRILGRLAFPLFAYQLTIGYLNTRDLSKYVNRLFWFGLLAQIPLFFLHGSLFPLNILLAFCLSLIVLDSLDRFNGPYKLFVLSFLPFFFFFDYGLYGLFLILIFRYRGYIKGYVFWLYLTFLYVFFTHSVIQFVSLFAFYVIRFAKSVSVSRSINLFFYWFYPLHLFLILFVRCIFF